MNLKQEWIIEPKHDIVSSVGPGRFMLGDLDSNGEPHVWLADKSGARLGYETFNLIGRFYEGFAKVWRVKERHPDRDNVDEFNFINDQGILISPIWS